MGNRTIKSYFCRAYTIGPLVNSKAFPQSAGPRLNLPRLVRDAGQFSPLTSRCLHTDVMLGVCPVDADEGSKGLKGLIGSGPHGTVTSRLKCPVPSQVEMSPLGLVS